MKTVLIRFCIALVLGILTASCGFAAGHSTASVLMASYSILFSVFISFATSFNTMGVRNERIRKEILDALRSMRHWSIVDYVYTAILFVFFADFPTSFTFWEIRINPPAILAMIAMVNLIASAINFSSLRNLKEKLEEKLLEEQ